jgi:hypothetical protein
MWLVYELAQGIHVFEFLVIALITTTTITSLHRDFSIHLFSGSLQSDVR